MRSLMKKVYPNYLSKYENCIQNNLNLLAGLAGRFPQLSKVKTDQIS